MKFPEVHASLAGYIGLLLVAIYVALFVAAVLYIRRYAIENKIKTYHWKVLVAYAVAFVACALMSVGLSLLLLSEKTSENVLALLSFLWHSFALGTLIFVFLGIIVDAFAEL